MSGFWVASWFLCGTLGLALGWKISTVHANDPDLDRVSGPGDAFYVLFGPLLLIVWVLIAVSYACFEDSE